MTAEIAESSDGSSSPSSPASTPADPPSLAPELLPARLAFERGDYREVRRLVDALLAPLEESPSDPLRKEAEALRARLAIDPLALWLGAGGLVFFLLVVYFTIIR